MPIIESSHILRLFDQAEQEVSVEQPFLVDRSSIALVSGTNTYTIPDYVLSIRRMTFNGIGLDPLPRRNQREVFQNSTQQGTPFWYIYNNIGINQIQLFPTPNVNLAQATGDLFSQVKIATGFIYEYYRVSDNSSFIIPPIYRRQLLKKYVFANTTMVDNKNMNMRMAKYYMSRWNLSKSDFFQIMRTLYNQPRRLVINDFNTFNFFPGSPVLPINRFGISVNEGE